MSRFVKLGLMLVLVVPLAAAAVPRTEVESYATLHPFPVSMITAPLGGCSSDALNVGGACFALDGSEQFVDVAVADATGLPVIAYVAFWSGSFSPLGNSDAFCASAADLVVPPGARYMSVQGFFPFVLTPCWPFASEGTTGTITATFT